MIIPAQNLPVFLRAFAAPLGSVRKPATRFQKHVPSPWTLIFDTETTTDPGQSLRVGAFELRNDGVLDESGMFYAPDLSAEEIELVRRYAKEHGLKCLTQNEFVDEFLFEKGLSLRATIVGFNLRFDLSRIAIRHGSARRSMRGGFTFKLSGDKRRPYLQIKHLSQKSALIRFTAPFLPRGSRSARKHGTQAPVERGTFVDVRTLATALFSRNFRLSTLSEFLNVPTIKVETEEHGLALTEEYLGYAVDDVQSAWECYVELVRRYEALDLRDTPPPLIYSEASIGKGYLKAMGLKPWREVQCASASLIGQILSTYFGGRSEMRIRREIRQVVLCDFLSMYPTVCTLMGLWQFVIADGVTWHDATDEARDLLETATLSDPQRPQFWRGLTTLVCIHPHKDVFPVRAEYDGEGQATIGANYISADGGLWFTLADCIAAKLHTGKAPRVLEAIRFHPGAMQKGLQPISLPGGAGTIDPTTEDFYKRLIEIRQDVKAQRDATPEGPEWEALDARQNALKIAANATTYGIFVEVNVEEQADKSRVTVHTGHCAPFEVDVQKIEKPGRYFHPLLATLITGAARLMLTTAERLVADYGLDWAFCDTDSIAIAKPEPMDGAEFLSRVDRLVSWFSELNPYAFGGSILKVEDVNFRIEDKETHEPLYCWGVSAKRYALFNKAEGGAPVLRKASGHGLGQMRAPYDDKAPCTTIPAPALKLPKLGVELWQHDLWWPIVRAALVGTPDQVDLSYHPNLNKPAVSRYAATSPKLLNWFATYNRNRAYARQVKPFGFLLSLFAKDEENTVVFLDGDAKSRPERKAKPVSPFDKDIDRAFENARDRDTGRVVKPEELKTYAEALARISHR